MEGENVIKLKARMGNSYRVNTLVVKRQSRKDVAVASGLKVSNPLTLFLEAVILFFQVIQPFTQ